MGSEKKPSIFSDRGAIGLAEELDEYGVWVKSEPEDMAFDDHAFLGEVENATGARERAVDFDDEATKTEAGEFASTDFDTPSDFDDFTDKEAGSTDSLDFDVAEEAAVDDNGFDVDFGSADSGAVDVAALDFDVVEEAAADDNGFDVDFGSADSGADEAAALDFDVAEEAGADDNGFDVDFGSADSDAVDVAALDFDVAEEAGADDNGFDVDFGSADSNAVDVAALDFDVAEEAEADDNRFDVDFGGADSGGGSVAALGFDVAEEADNEFDVDFGSTDSIGGEAAALDFDVAEEAAEADNGFDVNFGSADSGSDEVAELGFDVVEDAGEAGNRFDVDFGSADSGVGLAAPDFDVAGEAGEADTGFEIDFGSAESEPGALGSPGGYDFEISLDDIPDVPQISGEAEPHERNGEYELLLRIAGEISTIKEEINTLKKDILTMRSDSTRTAAETAEIPHPDEGEDDGFNVMESAVDAGITENAVNGRDEYADFDEASEALSGDELNAIINNCEIESEISEFAEDGAAGSGEDTSVDLDLSEVRDDVEAVESSPADALTALDDTGQENIVVPALEEEYFEAPPNEPDYLSPDDLPEENIEAALAGEYNEVFAEPEPPAVETPAATEAPPNVPDYLSPDDLPEENIEAALAGEYDEVFAEPEPPAVEPPPATEAPPPPQYTEPAGTPTDGTDQRQNTDILESEHFKKDLQVVLSYMDRLLEALPDEKIEEFARSEQFDIYKKVFKELGLV